MFFMHHYNYIHAKRNNGMDDENHVVNLKLSRQTDFNVVLVC